MICDFKDRFKNLKYLGEGAFRKAFTFGKDNHCVVKVPHRDIDKQHNLNEAIAWNNLPSNARKHFVPVLSYDKQGEWLIMPRVKSLEFDDSTRKKLQFEVMESIKKKGIWCDDVHIYNVGMSKNNPVILDYGFGCREYNEKNDYVTRPVTTSIWDINDEQYDFSNLYFFGK